MNELIIGLKFFMLISRILPAFVPSLLIIFLLSPNLALSLTECQRYTQIAIQESERAITAAGLAHSSAVSSSGAAKAGDKYGTRAMAAHANLMATESEASAVASEAAAAKSCGGGDAAAKAARAAAIEARKAANVADQMVRAADSINEADEKKVPVNRELSVLKCGDVSTMTVNPDCRDGQIIGESHETYYDKVDTMGRAEIQRGVRSGVVDQASKTNLDTITGNTSPVPATDAADAMRKAYEQMASTAKQAGVMNVGGKPTLTPAQVAGYQQMADTGRAGGITNIGGTTNTSYSYNPVTTQFTGLQNGMTYNSIPGAAGQGIQGQLAQIANQSAKGSLVTVDLGKNQGVVSVTNPITGSVNNYNVADGSLIDTQAATNLFSSESIGPLQGSTLWGNDTLGKFNNLSPLQKALLGEPVTKDQLNDMSNTFAEVLAGENAVIAGKIGRGEALTPAEMAEATGIVGVTINRGAATGQDALSFVDSKIFSSYGSASESRIAELNQHPDYFHKRVTDFYGSLLSGETVTQTFSPNTLQDVTPAPFATHFYAPDVITSPSWGSSIVPGSEVRIGEHSFSNVNLRGTNIQEFSLKTKGLPDYITTADVRSANPVDVVNLSQNRFSNTPGVNNPVVDNSIATKIRTQGISALTTADLNKLADDFINKNPEVVSVADVKETVSVQNVKDVIQAFENNKRSVDDYVIGVFADEGIFNRTETEMDNVAKRVAKLDYSLNGVRNQHTDVRANGLTIGQQVQLAATEYNLANNKQVSVQAFSEMGPVGSHRHRGPDDKAPFTGKPGCACAVDVAFFDENGRQLTVAEDGAAFKEISRNFVENTNGNANYGHFRNGKAYMGAQGVHFDLDQQSVRAYTKQSIANEQEFSRLRAQNNLYTVNKTTAKGNTYVGEYYVTPKTQTTIPMGQVDVSRLTGQQITPTLQPPAPSPLPITQPKGFQPPAGIQKSLVPIIKQIGVTTPITNPAQFLQSSIGLTGQVIGEAIGGRNGATIGRVIAENLGKLLVRNPQSSQPAQQSSGYSYADQNCQNNSIACRPSSMEEQKYIPVKITFNEQDGSIEFAREDIIETLKAVYEQDGLIDPDEFDENDDLRAFVSDETPILFGDNGEIIYSNGLYSPPVLGGERVENENIPAYVYVVDVINEEGQLADLSQSGAPVPDNFITGALKALLANSAPFTYEEVERVTYRLVDPTTNIPSDEYYEYIVYLKDGSIRTTTVPQFSSITQMNEQFGKMGYDENVLLLLGMAEDLESSSNSGNLIRKIVGSIAEYLKDFVDAIIKEDPISTGEVTELPSFENTINTDDLRSLFIYPNAEVSCPDIVGYDDGFSYIAVINDRNNSDRLYTVSRSRCGYGDASTLIAEAARDLRENFDVVDTTYESVLDKSYFRLESTYIVNGTATVDLSPEPQAAEPTAQQPTPTSEDGEPVFIPNTTNTISFEIKAVGSNGQVITDWTNAESLTISPGVQLYFRWNAADYQQCLAFFQDNGNYTLNRQDKALLSGNTETESYNLTERSGTYRIECGGQRNNEFGVDDKKVEVLVQ